MPGEEGLGKGKSSVPRGHCPWVAFLWPMSWSALAFKCGLVWMFKSQETSVTLIPAYPASLREKRRPNKNGPGVLVAVIDQQCISDPLSALRAPLLPHDPHHSLVSHHWGMRVSGHYCLTLGSFCSITLSTRLPWALSFSLWHQIKLWNLCDNLIELQGLILNPVLLFWKQSIWVSDLPIYTSGTCCLLPIPTHHFSLVLAPLVWT